MFINLEPLKQIIQLKQSNTVKPKPVNRILPPADILDAQTFINATIDFTTKYLALNPISINESSKSIYSSLLLYDVHNALLYENKLNDYLLDILTFLFENNCLIDSNKAYLYYLTGVFFYKKGRRHQNYKSILGIFDLCIESQCKSDFATLMSIESGLIKYHHIPTKSFINKAEEYSSNIKQAIGLPSNNQISVKTSTTKTSKNISKNKPIDSKKNKVRHYKFDDEQCDKECEDYYKKIIAEATNDYVIGIDRTNVTGWYYPDKD